MMFMNRLSSPPANPSGVVAALSRSTEAIALGERRAGTSVQPSDPVNVRPLLVTVLEAAHLLSVGRSTLYEMMWNGDVTAIHIGRSVRLAVAELEEFVATRLAS